MNRFDRLRLSGSQPTALARSEIPTGFALQSVESSVKARLILLTPATRPLRLFFDEGVRSAGAGAGSLTGCVEPAGLVLRHAAGLPVLQGFAPQLIRGNPCLAARYSRIHFVGFVPIPFVAETILWKCSTIALASWCRNQASPASSRSRSSFSLAARRLGSRSRSDASDMVGSSEDDDPARSVAEEPFTTHRAGPSTGHDSRCSRWPSVYQQTKRLFIRFDRSVDVDLNGREIQFPHGGQGLHCADEPLVSTVNALVVIGQRFHALAV